MCQILKTPIKLAIFRKQWCVTASAGKEKIQVLNIALAKQQFKSERNSCRGSYGDKPICILPNTCLTKGKVL
jgi:hypothetical protein